MKFNILNVLREDIPHRKYSAIIVCVSHMPHEDINRLISFCLTDIKRTGGYMHNHEYCGIRELAYTINKYRTAHFCDLQFSAPPSAIAELTNFLHKDPGVLRFVIKKIRVFVEGYSPILLLRNKKQEIFVINNVAKEPMSDLDKDDEALITNSYNVPNIDIETQ